MRRRCCLSQGSLRKGGDFNGPNPPQGWKCASTRRTLASRVVFRGFSQASSPASNVNVAFPAGVKQRCFMLKCATCSRNRKRIDFEQLVTGSLSPQPDPPSLPHRVKTAAARRASGQKMSKSALRLLFLVDTLRIHQHVLSIFPSSDIRVLNSFSSCCGPSRLSLLTAVWSSVVMRWSW